MQTIAKATGPGIQLMTQLGKQQGELPRFIRQIRSIEPWCVRNAASLSEGEQLNMPRGVTTPLQTSGHSANPQR